MELIQCCCLSSIVQTHLHWQYRICPVSCFLDWTACTQVVQCCGLSSNAAGRTSLLVEDFDKSLLAKHKEVTQTHPTQDCIQLLHANIQYSTRKVNRLIIYCYTMKLWLCGIEHRWRTRLACKSTSHYSSFIIGRKDSLCSHHDNLVLFAPKEADPQSRKQLSHAPSSPPGATVQNCPLTPAMFRWHQKLMNKQHNFASKRETTLQEEHKSLSHKALQLLPSLCRKACDHEIDSVNWNGSFVLPSSLASPCWFWQRFPERLAGDREP